jgi:hypothetical protein
VVCEAPTWRSTRLIVTEHGIPSQARASWGRSRLSRRRSHDLPGSRSTGQRVAGETGLHSKGLRGRAMHKSSLSPTGLGLLLWKATCRETCPCRLGRGQRKRAGRHLAGALLHSPGGRMEKGRESGTSSAAYPTWDIRSQHPFFFKNGCPK